MLVSRTSLGFVVFLLNKQYCLLVGTLPTEVSLLDINWLVFDFNKIEKERG